MLFTDSIHKHRIWAHTFQRIFTVKHKCYVLKVGKMTGSIISATVQWVGNFYTENIIYYRKQFFRRTFKHKFHKLIYLYFRSASPQVSSRGSSPSSVRLTTRSELTTAQRAASKSPLSASHDVALTRQDSSHSENSTSNLVSSLTRDLSGHEGSASPSLSMRSDPLRYSTGCSMANCNS